ncbi:MAG: uncharacterized protein H6Q90_3263 [Deltaproteobacteria bacterium]|nr:uncharacterized protein [Deltaproteobacteria bacterium]
MWLERRHCVRFASLLLVLGTLGCRPPGYGKGDPGDPDAAIDVTDASVEVDGFVATCNKAFRLDGRSTASSVWLTGDFVQWGGDLGHGATAFVLGLDGSWTGSYAFAAGPHQYKFIVSGTEWILDPTNPDQIDDGMGNQNSLFTCTP